VLLRAKNSRNARSCFTLISEIAKKDGVGALTKISEKRWEKICGASNFSDKNTTQAAFEISATRKLRHSLRLGAEEKLTYNRKFCPSP
jgi:hypothetical protein